MNSIARILLELDRQAEKRGVKKYTCLVLLTSGEKIEIEVTEKFGINSFYVQSKIASGGNSAGWTGVLDETCYIPHDHIELIVPIW